jgi:large subunit ribosomal protein L33
MVNIDGIIKRLNGSLFFFAYKTARDYHFSYGGVTMRVKITLACSECKQRNYNTMKNKKNDPDRLEMNKYCKFCRKHTLHKETK